MVFGHYIGQNCDDKQLVTIGEKLILDTGCFTQQFSNWKCLLAHDCEWMDFEPFWTTKLDLWHETTCTAAQTCYAGTVSDTTDNEEDKKAEQAYYDSLQLVQPPGTIQPSSTT